MTVKHSTYVIFLVVLLVACTTAASTATGTPAPTRIATSQVASSKNLAWLHPEGSQNLAQDPTWACVGGAKLVDGKLALRASSSYLTAVNARGPYLSFDGNFGVATFLEVVRGEWGAFVLFGVLPQGAWWQGIKRLDLEWHAGRVNVVFWDGTAQSPRFSRAFPAEGAGARAQIGLRRRGDQLAITVNGLEIGQMDDPGMFPENRAYLGANVPPNAELDIHDIRVEAETGREEMVQVISTSDEIDYVPHVPALRELADRHDIVIGPAVAPGPLRCEPAYAEALAHEFNILTAENAMKFGPIHPEQDRYAFDDADEIVGYAEAHDMMVRGHTLVWHNQLPNWVTEGKWTREELIEVLHDHITTVVGRYRGRIDVWDVVNEAIDDGGQRNTIWYRVIGPEYLDLAFHWAHEADPDTLLFYNDYGGEGMNRKSDAIYELVKGMLERDVPIHGVGLQMHVAAGGAPRLKDVLENMDRLAELGLEVHITELDVRIPGQVTTSKLDIQAQTYHEIAQTCLTAKRCTAFVMWGFTDRHSWIPGFFSGWGSGLILDESYQHKPAYSALQSALSGPQ